VQASVPTKRPAEVWPTIADKEPTRFGPTNSFGIIQARLSDCADRFDLSCFNQIKGISITRRNPGVEDVTDVGAGDDAFGAGAGVDDDAFSPCGAAVDPFVVFDVAYGGIEREAAQ
jgi:hypothetical protein